MLTFSPDGATEELDPWLLGYYSESRADKMEDGGWLTYRLNQEDTWKLQAAGSIRFRRTWKTTR
ncbi:hypothetical protein PC116_g24399 [Phytophthora cactorum]|nr:hypothetical protein PC116_g24399 [Phytophthora cactorum]